MRKIRRRRSVFSSAYIPPHKRYKKEKGFAVSIKGLFGRKKATDSLGARPQGKRQDVSVPPVALTGKASVALFAALTAAVLGGMLFLLWSLHYSDSSLPVTVVQNGFARTIWTKAATVGELFSQNGISPKENDHISHAYSSELQAHMEITIESPFPVAVASGGHVSVLYMREGTVGEALDLSGIDYSSHDEITRLTYEDVTPGMHIQHIDVETSYETVDRVIEYKEEVVNDSSRYIGNNKVKVAGEDGEKRIVRQLIYKDGALASREIMNQIILKEAVDQVIIKGTKFRAQTNYQGDDRPYKPKPTESEVKSTMVVPEITAYTHTGKRTATGRRTKIGYVAVNPKVIPYGTKLYIPGYGYCTAQDTGAFRHEQGGMKNQIDVLLNTEKECRSWGRKRNVTVYILK